MLHAIGIALEKAHWVVKAVAFDGHGSNCFVREALQGAFRTLRQEDMAEVPFFRHLVYRELPEHVLPRLPLRFATFKGRSIWPLCGP